MSRDINIDLIKFIAMLFVVGMHSRMHYLEYPTYDIAYYVFNACFTPAIPMFYMVSGYLLLGRKDADYGYSFRKIFGILRFVIIITFSYSLIYFLLKGNFDLRRLLVNTCLWPIQRGDMSIFWYFGAMIVIYMFYPLINRLFIQKRATIVVVSCVLVSSLISYMNLFTYELGGGRNECSTMF